jgi:hypothetical protein
VVGKRAGFLDEPLKSILNKKTGCKDEGLWRISLSKIKK